MNTKGLKPGTKVTVTSGPYEGHPATVVNPTPVPDGDPSGNQRRILITVDDVYTSDDTPFETYILPRLIEYADSDLPVYQQPYQAAAALPVNVHQGVMPMSTPITDPMDPALDRYRPDMDVVNRYIHRTLPGGYLERTCGHAPGRGACRPAHGSGSGRCRRSAVQRAIPADSRR